MAHTQWHARVDAANWDAVVTELDATGGALLPCLLTKPESAALKRLDTDDESFRSAVAMAATDSARDWWARLRRPAPWPGDWNALHRASTAIWCFRSRP